MIFNYLLFRDTVLGGDVNESLSSTLAGLRETYYDYNMAKHSEIQFILFNPSPKQIKILILVGSEEGRSVKHKTQVARRDSYSRCTLYRVSNSNLHQGLQFSTQNIPVHKMVYIPVPYRSWLPHLYVIIVHCTVQYSQIVHCTVQYSQIVHCTVQYSQITEIYFCTLLIRRQQ